MTLILQHLRRYGEVSIFLFRFTNTIGVPELISVWKNPEFNAKQSAFYYDRVIEISTPDWTAYDTKRFGVKLTCTIVTERACTSPDLIDAVAVNDLPSRPRSRSDGSRSGQILSPDPACSRRTRFRSSIAFGCL